MGRESCSKSRGFESRHCILDGHFFTYICCKNCNDVCLKRPKINEREAGVGPFFKKKTNNVNVCFLKNGPFTYVFLFSSYLHTVSSNFVQ